MTASPFPEFITARRRELELTLGDVAAGLGVSPITVSNWSSGESKPKAGNLVALANLLDVPADELAEMAGISLKSSPGSSVNLMPSDPADTAGDDTAGDHTAADDSPTEETDPSEPTAQLRSAAMAAGETVQEVEPAGVPIPMAEIEPPPVEEPASPDAIDSELVELMEQSAPELDDAPDSVPAFVTPAAPEETTAAPEEEAPAPEETTAAPEETTAAPEPAVTPSPRRRPTIRRPRPAVPASERQVTTLPLTYIEDPKQLLRYRIRWALTVVVLLVMFLVLLWASRELLSALSEVKQAVTPGGIGGG